MDQSNSLARITRNAIAYSSVDRYIASQPAAAQPVLNELRTLIQQAAPQAVEMISYDMPTYKLDGQRLVYFAVWKQHVGIYALPKEVLDQFADAVTVYRQPKGTLQFPYSQPLPGGLIRDLVSANMKRLQTVEA